MAARRKIAQGLSSDQLSELRGQLAEGRRPRVQLSGPQFAAGSTGTVVRIGDPDRDGADYLTVRVKVNGITDELAFAPAELSRGLRGGADPDQTSTGRARSAKRPAAEVQAEAQSPMPGERSRPAKRPAEVQAAAQPPVPDPLAVATRPGRRRKAAAAPKVSFTIASAGATWSVSAVRGARSIVRNVSVPPGVVTAIAGLIEQPALAEAVAEINDTALAEAQLRADQLRAELGQLEAVLATHRTPRPPTAHPTAPHSAARM